MIRAVLDANVFISALISPLGRSRKIIDGWARESRLQVVASTEIFEEVSRVAFYGRVRKYIQLNDAEILRWIASMEVLSDIVIPTAHVSVVVGDPDDNVYIEVALEGRAQYLVSGDEHLLSLRRFQDVQIIKPADFIKLI